MKLIIIICLFVVFRGSAFALDDEAKRAIVEKTRASAVKHLDRSLEFARNHPELSEVVGGRDVTAGIEYMQTRLSSPEWSFLLESESDYERRKKCRSGFAVSNGKIMTICEDSFLSTDDGELLNSLLHETYHEYQKNILHQRLSDSPTIECPASEMAALPLLVYGNYNISNGYIEQKECDSSSYYDLIRAVQKILKQGTLKLNIGQLLTVNTKMKPQDVLQLPPKTYLFFNGNNEGKEGVVDIITRSRSWLIEDMMPGRIFLTILLKKPGTNIVQELQVASMGLEIYTDDFEAAFSGKVKVTSANSK